MGALRAAATAVLILTTAAIADAQCVSEGRLISTRQSVPNLVAGPAAWGNGVLLVAKYERNERSIFLAAYDHEFNQLTSDTLISSDTSDGPLFLIFNGVDFGLIYRTESDERLLVQRISTAGQPVGAPAEVSTRRIRFDEDVDAVWSPSLNAYVIATTWRVRALIDVVVTVMERNGTIRHDIPVNVFASQDEPELSVAVADNGTIGVIYRDEIENVVFAHISRDSNAAPVDTIWTPGRDVKATAIGNNFYVIKTVRVSGRDEVRWLVLNSNGSIAAPDRLLMRGSDLELQTLALTTLKGELVLTYLDAALGLENQPGEYRLHRFDTAGNNISDSLFIPPDNFTHRFAYTDFDPVWTGRAFISSAVYETTRELDSLLIRLCVLQAFVSAERTTATVEDSIGFSASAQGGNPGYTFRWDMGDRSGVRVGANIRHRYIHPGTYDVVVTATDSTGVATSATIRVRITEFKKRAVRR